MVNDGDFKDQFEATSASLVQVFEKGPYVVPQYQRPYAWNKTNAKELLASLEAGFYKACAPNHKEQEQQQARKGLMVQRKEVRGKRFVVVHGVVRGVYDSRGDETQTSDEDVCQCLQRRGFLKESASHFRVQLGSIHLVIASVHIVHVQKQLASTSV